MVLFVILSTVLAAVGDLGANTLKFLLFLLVAVSAFGKVTSEDHLLLQPMLNYQVLVWLQVQLAQPRF